MPRATAGEVELEYEVFGDPADQPLLLIMGLGGQMLHWDDDFCRSLAHRGHFVIRFDNRDAGLSTSFDEAGVPDLMEIVMKGMAGEPVSTPYTLDDMADDTMGILDTLGIESAHFCGVSMGGMIAQAAAIGHPERVRSLASIMSTTGDRALPPPTAEAQAVLSTPLPTEREACIEERVRRDRVVGSKTHPAPEDYVRARAELTYDRSFSPEGTARQMAAVAAHGDRTPRLRELQLPALVIHGLEDPLIPHESGLATQRAIPGAELLLLQGMGHDLPRPLWDEIIGGLSELTKRASAAR